MNDERFSIECEDGECTIWYKKPYETQYAIVMEIGYKRENSADEYYFTKDEAIAMAKKICAELEQERGKRTADSLEDNGGQRRATTSMDSTDATGQRNERASALCAASL